MLIHCLLCQEPAAVNCNGSAEQPQYLTVARSSVRNLLLGLACNESTEGVELDLSSNGLGSTGAHVLESCIHGVKCISSLDISENGTPRQQHAATP